MMDIYEIEEYKVDIEVCACLNDQCFLISLGSSSLYYKLVSYKNIQHTEWQYQH